MVLRSFSALLFNLFSPRDSIVGFLPPLPTFAPRPMLLPTRLCKHGAELKLKSKTKWSLGGENAGKNGLYSGSIGNEDGFSRMLFSFFSCRLFDIPALCTTRNGIWLNSFKDKSAAIATS